MNSELEHREFETKFWPDPKAKSVGQFTDFRLYFEALEVTEVLGYVNIEIITKLLPERIKGLKFIQSFKPRTYTDLFRELTLFGYLRRSDKGDGYFKLTNSGKVTLNTYLKSQDLFNQILLQKMQEAFVIPGWLINRLWELNPNGQGQLIIPSPIKEWKPKSRDWKDSDWDAELNEVCFKTAQVIYKKNPDAFPLDANSWVEMIKNEYIRMGSGSHTSIKKNLHSVSTRINKLKFSTRMRLTLAMKSVTIKYFFGNVNPLTNKKDFSRTKSPLDARSFMVWCPRLEFSGLLFYTDYNRDIPGRILFPTSIFSFKKDETKFKKLDNIRRPNNDCLFIFNPDFLTIRKEFLLTLFEVYQRIYNRDEIIYVSIQEVRDETCRILRISASLFEKYLEKAFRESVQRTIPIAISLETDIRGDQKNAYQIVRRAVFINNVPHSLIAIKQK